MDEDGLQSGFLGLQNEDDNPDIAIIPVPYELTTSYGHGTINGPKSCIEASWQVELFDDKLEDEIPAGFKIHTAPFWETDKGTLAGQLDEIAQLAKDWHQHHAFPIFIGGEHGILPPIIRGFGGDITVIQIDAHADLRSQLDGEKYSHACAAARAMDEGAVALFQAGIRAYSKEEFERIKKDENIHTWFARDIFHHIDGSNHWNNWLKSIAAIRGPVHLSIDIDGLDGSLVPATGTPVPGGLTYWHAVQTIETAFENLNVVSADVNEIVPQKHSPLTQFTAAMLVTKIIGCKLNELRNSIESSNNQT